MWFARPGQRRESAVSITGTLGQRQRRFQSGRVSGLATRSPLSPTLWWVLHSRWMPVDRPSVVVVACTARISYRKPRPVWTFDERQGLARTSSYLAGLFRPGLPLLERKGP